MSRWKHGLRAFIGVPEIGGPGPSGHRLAYRIGGALMLVSATLVLLTTFVLDAMAQPHGRHRHAIVYAICAVAAGTGVWQMLRRRTASPKPLYLSMPILICLGCAPLLARHGSPLALLILDIDHFKSINDKLRHPRGDDVLSWLGRFLAEQVRPSDLASRIGGEEFARVLPARRWTTPSPGLLRCAQPSRRRPRGGGSRSRRRSA